MKLIRIAISLFLAVPTHAAMVRVVEVRDARTIVIEDKGQAVPITLAGLTITDPAGAKALLEWTLHSRWVMLESRDGGALVYRSPDALFVNRELVTRGFAIATLPDLLPQHQVPVTYLGTLRPAGARSAPAATATGSGSGTRRRPSIPRPPSRRKGKG